MYFLSPAFACIVFLVTCIYLHCPLVQPAKYKECSLTMLELKKRPSQKLKSPRGEFHPQAEATRGNLGSWGVGWVGGWGAQGFPSPELVLTSLAVGAKVKFQPTRSVSGTGKPADSTATCELSQRLILKWILGYVLHVSGHGWVAVSDIH